jgi:hypothetical protein
MPSYVQFDVWQNTAGVTRTSVLQTQTTYSNTKVNVTTASSWVEPSTDYRVTITPTFTNSMIHVTFYVPLNVYWSGVSANCLKLFRAFRSVGGTKNYALSSAGTAGGSRFNISGHAFRTGNGYDYNDQQAERWDAIDFPATTSQVTYGFEFLQEASSASGNYFGYSASDNGTWGYSSRIIIIAQEIAQ